MTKKNSFIDTVAAASFPAGPVTAAVAIFWVHGDNIARHPESYIEAPPTISRALWDPAIAAPFAWVMVLCAVFLCASIVQVAVTLGRLARCLPGEALNVLLLAAFTCCEAVAIAGMIVLSQYTGAVDSHLHDTGSFMLFFGHAFGISLSGWILHRMKSSKPADDQGKAAVKVLQAVHGSPRHAFFIALLSAIYGVIYFGGKMIPDQYFFWQRLVMSVTEVILILAFLAYLQSLWPMVRAGRALR